MTRKSVAFYSPGGGSGKTSLAINIAEVAAQEQKKVLLADFSLAGGLEMFYKIAGNTSKGLGPLITRLEQGYLHLDNEAIHGAIYAHENHKNLHILTSPGLLAADRLDYKTSQNLVTALLKLSYDLVIFDCSSELSERTVAVLEQADRVMVPVLQDHMQVWKLLQMREVLESLRIEWTKCSIILNRQSKMVPMDRGEVEVLTGLTITHAVQDMGAECIELTNEGKGWQQLANFKNRKIYPAFKKWSLGVIA